MCGRYLLTATLEAMIKRFTVLAEDTDIAELSPRYNIAPAQPAPVVSMEDGRRRLRTKRWGLIDGYATFNARAETLAEKPSYREPFRRRRCLVPADGFYEWRRAGKERLPVRFVPRSGGLLVMAGLWEKDRFTIVTVPSAGAARELHDRMPAILEPGQEAAWLDPESAPERVTELLKPTDVLASHPASRLVNFVTNEGPKCLDPDEYPAGETPTFL